MSSKPFVSIVIPVYNEEYVLADCLAALQQQDYAGPYEIIVVNNACTDRSPEIARAMGARVVSEPHKGYVHALRAGFAAARGEIIACTDADTIVPPDWLSRLVEVLLEDPEVVAVSGVFDLHDCSPWLGALGSLASRLNWHLAGGNMAVWRRAYEAVGGFDPAVNLGADTELGLRLQRLGRVVIDRRLAVNTSGRRIQHALWQTLWMYLLNDLWLILFGHPRFYDFPDIRVAPRRHLPVRRLSGAGALLTLLSLLVFTAMSPGAQTFGPVLAHGPAGQPVVALTFDDGPSPDTAEVLDILAHYQVKATFFVIGQNVQRHPDLARRIVAEGHAIGNHTYSHPLWVAVETPGQVARELDGAAAAIQAATGVYPTLFRPPHGWRSPWMLHLAHRKGYTVVTWSVSPDDWRQPPPGAIAMRVLQRVRPGAIILLHDGLDTRGNPPMQNTVDALPAIIEGLQARGYHFVTVPELMRVAGQE
jgi:peptidoglycan/xylan/chitin deacetylase (PgdA/CDA1 family)